MKSDRQIPSAAMQCSDRPNMTRSERSGFTLVEVLVASVIGAFIAVVAVGALRAVSAGSERLDDNIDTAAEVRFAASIIARDLNNLYRDEDVKNMKLVGLIGQSGAMPASRLVLYTVGRTKARAGQPEGDVYEVEYCLKESRKENKTVLLRRLWPNPDKEVEPGGMLTVIAENIDVFQVRYFDGEQWQLEWSEQLESIPVLVEVNIAARQADGKDTVMETFMVNFPRSGWGQGQADTTEQGEEEEQDEEQEKGEEKGQR